MSGEVSAAVHSWTSHKITTGRIEKKAKKVLEEKEWKSSKDVQREEEPDVNKTKNQLSGYKKSKEK